MSVTLAAAQSLHAIHLSLALAATTGPPLPPKTAVKLSHHLHVQLPHPHMHTSACQIQNTFLPRSEGVTVPLPLQRAFLFSLPSCHAWNVPRICVPV